MRVEVGDVVVWLAREEGSLVGAGRNISAVEAMAADSSYTQGCINSFRD
jgi:hypothetical protein